MKGVRLIQRLAACLATVGFCFPQLAFAATPQDSKTLITDVQLLKGGVLVGQVVTPENAAIVNTNVSLLSANQKLSEAKTDGSGYFAFRGLTPGVYQVATAQGQGAYRVWAEGAAPPSAKAQAGALVVAGQDTVRGQGRAQGLRNFFANPLVIAGIVATAIAVPVAIHNSKKHSGS